MQVPWLYHNTAKYRKGMGLMQSGHVCEQVGKRDAGELLVLLITTHWSRASCENGNVLL
jgi:hypothetical protein